MDCTVSAILIAANEAEFLFPLLFRILGLVESYISFKAGWWHGGTPQGRVARNQMTHER
jgi:hypothetical protein